MCSGAATVSGSLIYGEDEDLAEEPLYRLGDHVFAVGEYVTITDEDDRPLTYKVTELAAA